MPPVSCWRKTSQLWLIRSWDNHVEQSEIETSSFFRSFKTEDLLRNPHHFRLNSSLVPSFLMTGTGISYPSWKWVLHTDAVSEARAYELKKRREVRAMMRELAVHDMGVSINGGTPIWHSVLVPKGVLDRSRLRDMAVLRQDERKAVVQEKLYQQWRAGADGMAEMGGTRWTTNSLCQKTRISRDHRHQTSASRNLHRHWWPAYDGLQNRGVADHCRQGLPAGWQSPPQSRGRGKSHGDISSTMDLSCFCHMFPSWKWRVEGMPQESSNSTWSKLLRSSFDHIWWSRRRESTTSMPSFGGEAARISRNTSLWTYIYII